MVDDNVYLILCGNVALHKFFN